MSIAENVKLIKENIAAAAMRCGRDPKEIKLVAATKMNDASRVREAIAAGVDICGENRVQELQEKLAQGGVIGCYVVHGLLLFVCLFYIRLSSFVRKRYEIIASFYHKSTKNSLELLGTFTVKTGLYCYRKGQMLYFIYSL